MSTMYDSSTIGTPTNFITFNNYAASPIFRVRQTRPTKRDIREQDANIPESMGVADFEAIVGKSYFIIEGTMYPSNEDEYYRGRERLRALGSLELSQSDAASDYGYVPYVWSEAGRGRQLPVKVMYVDGLGESTRQGFAQPFRLYCKIKYPVIFGTIVKSAVLNVATALVSTGGTSIPSYIPTLIGSSGVTGGTVLPTTLPVVLNSSSATPPGGTVENEGDISAYPTVIIYGPVNKPKILNTTTGEYIEIDTILQAGQSIILTYDQDTISLVGPDGNSIYNKLTTASTLFRIKPGVNNLTMSGSFLGSTAYATVNFLDAYPMS